MGKNRNLHMKRMRRLESRGDDAHCKHDEQCDGKSGSGDGECVIWGDGLSAKITAWHFFFARWRTKATKTVADAGVEVSINDMTRLIMGVNVELNGDRNTVKMVQKVFSPEVC